MGKDYYSILGLSDKNASEAEIKKAYKKVCLRCCFESEEADFVMLL